jgi:hypothetical protein
VKDAKTQFFRPILSTIVHELQLVVSQSMMGENRAVYASGAGIGRIRMRCVPDASAKSLMAFVEDSIDRGSLIHTDGWPAYDSAKSKCAGSA